MDKVQKPSINECCTPSSEPYRAKNFFFSTFFQADSGVHPTSYPMGTGGSFFGDNDHSPPNTAEVKKMRIYTSTPPYDLMA
jgi:hypothetical protein